MTWRPWLEPGVLRHMRGLLPGARDALIRVVARVCDGPFGWVYSKPVSGDGLDRLAGLGDNGFIGFSIGGDHDLIRVCRLVRTG